VNAQPGEPGRRNEPADDVPPAAATWVPPEAAVPGARPAWLPPGGLGQPYGPDYGPDYGPQPYAAPPGWPPPQYGQAPVQGRRGMPRWAKIVLIVGVIFYALAFIGQMVDLFLLSR
jgi:hypothetical protein